MLVVNIRRLNQCRPDRVLLRNQHTARLEQAATRINDGWNGFFEQRQNPSRIGYQHVARFRKLDLK